MSRELIDSEFVLVCEVVAMIEKKFGSENAMNFIELMSRNYFLPEKERLPIYKWVGKKNKKSKHKKKRNNFRKIAINGSDENDDFLKTLKKDE
ncbi:MAG: hypothetical protein LBQ37_01410 [Elusimicrobiota bacterium]|nr:hypothetical protein [Elusimicrobiota bacterium]